MGRVFISYRRADSVGHAMWIRDWLDRAGANVFFDLNTIVPGSDFVDCINDGTESSDAMVVIIGPQWAGATGPTGGRRLDEPGDYVRRELAAALQRRIQVIPVLVKQATMPTEADLPAELRRLPRIHGVEFDERRREDDVRCIFNKLALRPDLPFCDACQQPVDASAKFCANCGHPVTRRSSEGSPDEQRLVTLLSATIETAEQAAGRVSAEELRAIRAECFSAGCERIRAYGGQAQRTESRIIASFGLDQANEDDAERAARAALYLRDLVIGRAREHDSGDGLCLRIGVNTGWTTTDAEQNPVGPVSDRAADLAQQAEPGTIRVGEATARCLADHFDLVVELALEEAADQPEPESARLIGIREGSPSAQRAPLIGRQEQIATMRRCLDDLLRVGHGHVLGISGEAGTGVSRLLEELRSLPAPGVVWLRGRCPSYGTAMKYVPFIDALRDDLGVVEGESDSRVRALLRSRVEALLGEQTTTVLPYLGALLGLAPVGELEERVSRLEPAHRKAGLHNAYPTFVEALSRTAPVVLVVEDLHWADPSTIELAADLLPLTRHAPVLLVAGFRPDVDSQAWSLRRKVYDEYPPPHYSTEVQLDPLTPEETRALAQSLLPGQPAAVLDDIVKRAEGNPLYVDILLQGLRESGALEAVSKTSRSSGSLPATLEGVLFARIDRLPAAPRKAAQTGAVIGRDFRKRILDKVEATDLRHELDVLGARNVARLLRWIPGTDLAAADAEYTFTHGFVQEALLTTLGAQRRAVHGRVADAIEKHFADGLDKYAELLAYHYSESDDRAKALEYCERAGQEGFSIHANQQAVEWWTKSLDIAVELGEEEARRRVMRSLADLLVLMGQLDQAAAYYRELAVTATTEDEAAIVLADAAWAMVTKDAYQEGAALIDQADALAPGTVHARAAIEMARAQAAWGRHQIDRMGSILERMEREPLGNLPTEPTLRRMQLWVTYLDELGDRDRAGLWERQMLSLAEERGDPQLLLTAEFNAGITKTDAGELEAARDLLTRCCASAQKLGFVTHLVKAGVNNLYTMYLQGDVLAGVALAKDLEPIVTLPRWRAMYRVHWGLLELERGQPTDAHPHLRIALETAQSLDNHHLVAQAAIALAGIDVALGLCGEAEAAITAALPAAGVGDRLLGHRWLAEVALRQGQPAAAVAQAEEALTFPVSDCEKVPLWRVLGAAREALSPGSGRGDIERALTVAHDTGRGLEEARALLQLAGLAGTPDAPGCLERARAIFEEKGVPLPAAATATDTSTGHMASRVAPLG